MQYLKTYLKKITDRGNTKLAESIEKTANDVGNTYKNIFFFQSSNWTVVGKRSVWKNRPDVWNYM